MLTTELKKLATEKSLQPDISSVSPSSEQLKFELFTVANLHFQLS